MTILKKGVAEVVDVLEALPYETAVDLGNEIRLALARHDNANPYAVVALILAAARGAMEPEGQRPVPALVYSRIDPK